MPPKYRLFRAIAPGMKAPIAFFSEAARQRWIETGTGRRAVTWAEARKLRRGVPSPPAIPQLITARGLSPHKKG